MNSRVHPLRLRARRVAWLIRQRHVWLRGGGLWERALQRALGWRRTAILRDRVGRRRALRRGGTATPAVATAPPGTGQGAAGSASLAPILVDHVGRDGSTLLMRLLASSPQIAIEGPYPFERKYFAYLWRWAMLLDRREWPPESWGPNDLASIAQDVEQPLIGPPPWIPRSLTEDRSDPFSRRCFELAWEEFSRRAAASTAREHGGDEAEVRYYAEKHVGSWRAAPEALAQARLVVLLRDPRDVFVSGMAFSERRGEAAFGWRQHGDEEHLQRFVVGHRPRLRWIESLSEGPALRLVAYEDLVRDLGGVADRIAEWLGVELDPAAAASDRRLRSLHVTAADPERSIGRWRKELPDEVVEVFRRELGPQLEALGFEP